MLCFLCASCRNRLSDKLVWVRHPLVKHACTLNFCRHLSLVPCMMERTTLVEMCAGGNDNCTSWNNMLRWLCSDCFDSKVQGAPSVEAISQQLNSSVQLPSYLTANNHLFFPAPSSSFAPTRHSAPQLPDAVTPRTMHERIAMHETPESQSLQSPTTPHASFWGASTGAANQTLQSAHCMLSMSALMNAGGSSTPQKVSQLTPVLKETADCDADDVIMTPSRGSPSSGDPSNSGGSTRFVATFPWVNSQPKNKVATPSNSNAATSSLVHMHGNLSASASFHSMHGNFSTNSCDDLTTTPFRMCSRESSVKAGAEAALPEVTRSFHRASNSDISGPNAEPQPENWSEVASHAVLSSAASALLGFYPSTPTGMQTIAPFTNLPAATAAPIQENLALQSTFAMNAGFESMHAPHAYAPASALEAPHCGSKPPSSPCVSPRTKGPAEPPADSLAYHVSGALNAFSCEKLAACNVATGVFTHPEAYNALDALMDMEPSSTPDLLFDGFKHW